MAALGTQLPILLWLGRAEAGASLAQGTPTWRGWAREVPDMTGQARTINLTGWAREVPDVTGQSHYEGSTHN